MLEVLQHCAYIYDGMHSHMERIRGLAVNVNRAPFSSRNTALAHLGTPHQATMWGRCRRRSRISP